MREDIALAIKTYNNVGIHIDPLGGDHWRYENIEGRTSYKTTEELVQDAADLRAQGIGLRPTLLAVKPRVNPFGTIPLRGARFRV